MRLPIGFRADHEVDAYEIAYGRLPDAGFVHHDERIVPGAGAAIGPAGDVVAIELLDLQPATLAAAAAYAAARGLAFPADVRRLVAAS